MLLKLPDQHRHPQLFYAPLDRLVLGQQRHLAVQRHPRRPLDHDPVFRAVEMALQAQGLAGQHGDALDLEPPADQQAFEPAPGAMIFGKGFGLWRMRLNFFIGILKIS